MTTDITELAQRMKAAAVRAKAATEDYVAHRMSITVYLEECKEFNDLSDGPDNIIALVEALEKAQTKIIELQQKCEIDPRTHEIIDLKERIENLEYFRTAYMEWGDKTDWMQTDKRFDAMKPWGKHRADVLKEYIDQLESRTVTVKPMRPGHITVGGEKIGIYMRDEVDEFIAALTVAGIKWETE